MSDKKIENNNNGNFWLYVIISLLVIIIIIFVGLVASGFLVYNETNNKVNENVEEKNDKLVITDDLKTDLASKIDALLVGRKNIEFDENLNGNTAYFNGFALLRELTDSEKQRITKSALIFENIFDKTGEEFDRAKNYIESYLGNGYLDTYFSSTYGVTTYEKYNKKYRELFGVDAPGFEDIRDMCSDEFYNKEHGEIYYVKGACGSNSAIDYTYHKSKFEINNDKVEVYVNIGYITFNDSYGTSHSVYGDIETSELDGKLYLGGDPINFVEEIKNYSSLNNPYYINDNNKDKFSEYKFTFAKDKENDNFYFEKVTKVR